MKLKIAVGTALVIFTVGVSSILITNYATKGNRQSQSSSASNTQSAAITVAEVAKHSTADDCWIIVNSNVYNVTSFIRSHPGGADRIIGQCGKDATTAFQTQGGRGSHSAAAQSQLESLKIGALGSTQSAPQSTTGQPNSSTNQVALPSTILSRYPNATLIASDQSGDDQQYRISVQGQCREVRIKDGTIERDREC